jgi:hypothetical protein
MCIDHGDEGEDSVTALLTKDVWKESCVALLRTKKLTERFIQTNPDQGGCRGQPDHIDQGPRQEREGQRAEALARTQIHQEKV